MKTTTSMFPKIIVAFMLIIFCSAFKDGDDDPLNKRVFYASFSESKDGVVAKKVISDEITFKNGKLRSNFIYKKFGFKWIRYRINKDSIYIDETDTEVRLLEIEAVITDDANQTVKMNFTTLEWGLDGVVKIFKGDRLKRYYDLIGREKGGKPPKKKKDKEIENSDDNLSQT